MMPELALAGNGNAIQLTSVLAGNEHSYASIAQRLAHKQEIQPNAVYGRDEAVAVTGFSLSTLIRAEDRGDLLGRFNGRRRYYLGSDLLKWLKGQKEGGVEQWNK